MNAISLRLAQRRELEENLSDVLDQYRPGEEFTSSAFDFLGQIQYQPIDLEKLKLSSDEKNRGRRLAPRYEFKMTALICNHRRAFRTETENISLTGLLLKDTLPEDFSRHFFEVVIIAESRGQKNYLFFRGRSLGERLRSPRIVFESVTPDTEHKLSEIFQSLKCLG
jgi:hypothetical protein